MKINSVYISAFGKFKDYTIDFSEGANFIYGENEDGKTTLLNFIKMMFYGTAGRQTDLLKNPRKKYAPWDGSVMAGRIDFTHGGKNWRIERIFKATNASDKIVLTDLSTGERENFSGGTDMGQRFIGLSAAAFERSAFIGQLGAGEKDNDSESEINSRLSSLCTTADEGVSAETVMKRILTAKEALMSKSGKVGIYDKTIKRIEELKDILADSQRAENDRRTLSLKVENESSRLASVNKEIDRISAQLREFENDRRYRYLKEYTESLQTLESLEKKLLKCNGTLISREDLSAAEKDIAEYKILSEQYPDIKETLSLLGKEEDALKKEEVTQDDQKIIDAVNSLEKMKDDLDNNIKEISQAEARYQTLIGEKEGFSAKKAKPNFTFLFILVFAAALIFTSFVLTTLKTVFLAAAGILAVISLILTFTVKKKPAPFPMEKETELKALKDKLVILNEEGKHLDSQITEKESYITALKESNALAKQVYEAKLKEHAEKTAVFNATHQKITDISKRLCELFNNFDINTSAKGLDIMLFALKDNYQKADNIRSKLNVYINELGDITIESAKEELASFSNRDINNIDPKVLAARLEYKKDEALGIQRSILENEAHLRNDFKKYRHPTDIEHEISDLIKKSENQKQFCMCADIAAETLLSAFAEMRNSYSSDLEKRAGEIFAGLCNGKYKSVAVSKDFQIAVEEADIFGTKEWQYLSSGAIDQAYFALRLAVSELLNKDGESLPIFIDDAFCQYDDTRLNAAIEFVKEYSKNNQVILFSCRKSTFGQNEFINLINK